MSQALECPFCAIVRGDDSARIVWSDEHSVAFLPLSPAALGHTLVVPRAHVEDIWALDGVLAGQLAQSVLRVAWGVRRALRPDGLNVINSAGEAASQTVLHLHMHVVPRWQGDNFGSIWPPPQPWREGVEDEVARLVREACAPPSADDCHEDRQH